MLSPCANHGTLHEDKAGQEKYSEGGLPVIFCCCSTCTLTKLHTSIEQTFPETPLGRPFQFVMEWRELEDRVQSLGEVPCFFDAGGRKRCHDSLLLLFCSPFPLVMPPNGTKSCYLFLRQSPDRLYKPLMPRFMLGKHFLPVYEWPRHGILYTVMAEIKQNTAPSSVASHLRIVLGRQGQDSLIGLCFEMLRMYHLDRQIALAYNYR